MNMKNEDIILEVKHLRKGYKKTEVLKDISFEMKKGSIMGLLGRNGAGKTTLLKCILGINVGYEGEIVFKNKEMNHEDEEVKKKIGSLVDVTFFGDLSAYDNLKLSMMITKDYPMKNKIEELLNLVDLSKDKNKKVKNFSFGMKQRLALAQAFIAEPELLILDEPFVGLDPAGICDMKDFLKTIIKEKKTSIIFSSHQLDEVEDLAEDIIVLKDGYINYDDSYENIKNNNISLIDLIR
jgi:ABC-2 type transport system ATP-binding protein